MQNLRKIETAAQKIELLYTTPSEWKEIAVKNFDLFIVDHAACERKASAMGMQFVVRYPDKPYLIEAMIRFAREELYHFHQVCKWVLKRGLNLASDEKNIYINALLSKVRNGREEHFLDRLLVCGIVEARGHERFSMMAEALEPGELKTFYEKISLAETEHHELFIQISLKYFNEEKVYARLHELLQVEAEVIKSLPLRPAVH
ncbi:MAG: tRNA-(ms[2]io[6]A)-hydroxylase [Deltaproteobacteria bacterium]|nr:tRNA-(ms[2]io[6]A)-hydroxylase [Deltaproteobacteria bacterium]